MLQQERPTECKREDLKKDTGAEETRDTEGKKFSVRHEFMPVTLNVHRLNNSVKRQRWSDQMKSEIPLCAAYRGRILDLKILIG